MSEDTTAYYEGIYTVRVLSDRPQVGIYDSEDLASLLQDCICGDMVGEIVSQLAREVTPSHMSALLTQAGSEPGFFQLEDFESLAQDLADSASDEGCSPDLVVVGRAELNAILARLEGYHKFETDDEEE